HSATTGFYTLSLHDALPILAVLLGRSAELRKDAAAHLGTIARLREQIDSLNARLKELDEELDSLAPQPGAVQETLQRLRELSEQDRKSTRLNSSHVKISYAV